MLFYLPALLWDPRLKHISNNRELTKTAPLLVFPVNKLNVSDTAVAMHHYFYYPYSSKNLKTLIFNNSVNPFTSKMLKSSSIEKLVFRNSRFGATNLNTNRQVTHLDVQGCEFDGALWQGSPTLKYLNIAFTDFSDFKALTAYSNLDTLVISDSVGIPDEIINTMKSQGTKVDIKRNHETH